MAAIAPTVRNVIVKNYYDAVIVSEAVRLDKKRLEDDPTATPKFPTTATTLDIPVGGAGSPVSGDVYMWSTSVWGGAFVKDLMEEWKDGLVWCPPELVAEAVPEGRVLKYFYDEDPVLSPGPRGSPCLERVVYAFNKQQNLDDPIWRGTKMMLICYTSGEDTESVAVSEHPDLSCVSPPKLG